MGYSLCMMADLSNVLLSRIFSLNVSDLRKEFLICCFSLCQKLKFKENI